MRRVAIAAAALSLSMAGAVAAPYEIKISDGRPDAMYRLGETCRFTLRARDLATNDVSRGGVVKVKVDNFGERVFAAREWDPAAEPVLEVSGTMDEPGFLRVVAMSAPRQPGALWALGRGNACWSVGFEPERIRPGSARPADFDAYWDGERARLAREVPPDFRRERVDWLCDGGFDVWKVSAATFGGKRTWGFLVEPKGLSSVPLPLYVNVPGAGPALSEAGTRQFMKQGEIHLVVNVHPYEPAKDFAGQNELYKAQDAACAKKYGCNYAIAGGAVSREEFFFHDALLGIDRVLSWAVALPEVDRGRVRYRGGSQGGGMGIALCAINPAIGRAVFQVPAITDLCGFRAGRQSGWPLLVERQKNPAAKAAAEAIAPYFDAVHFAPRVKIPLRVEAGLSDTTCPPPCVYAAFNAFGSTDKKMVNSIGCGHGGSKENRAKLAEWLRAEDGAGPRPFVPVLIHSGKNTDPAVFAKELAVFRDAVPIYPIADYSVNPKKRITPFRKHDEYRKYYVQSIPDNMRRKTPYGILDFFGANPRNTIDSDYARSGKPFFVYERISRPPFFLPGDGCPLADRAAYADWKKSHPGFLGFASLWEIDSDSTYLARFYDKIMDESARAALHSAFRRPDEKGASYRFDWAREAFRRARDFHFGEGAVWPMCSNFMGYEHFFGALGAAGLWYEATSQHFGAWNAAAAFLRGAARQRGLDYGWYMAQYYSGFNRKGEHLVGDSRWTEKAAGASGACRYRGESRSLHRRQVAYGWLIGAKYIEMEGWKLIYTDEEDGRLVPTENARDFNEVYELACRVDRGEPFTPLAVLTPLAEPCSALYANDDLLDPESQKAIFDTLVPIRGHNGENIPKRAKGQQGCLYNSEFAGFFDALCPDSGQDSAAFEKALSRYRHVLIAGEAFDKEKFDSRAIAAFEKAGGKVHRYPSPECPTKEKLRELLLKIQNETMPFAVEGDIQWGVNKTSNGWLVYLINNKGVVKFCDEPEEFDMSKTAHVIVTIRSTGERREVDIAPGDFKLLEFPFSSTER